MPMRRLLLLPILLTILSLLSCAPNQETEEDPIHLLLLPGEAGYFADQLYLGAVEEASEGDIRISLANEVLGSDPVRASRLLSQKRFDGVILRPSVAFNENALRDLIASAELPVVTINTDIAPQIDPDSGLRLPLTQVGSDHILAGRLAASFVSEELGRSGDLYINSSNPASGHHERSIASFYASVSGNPAMRMVGIDYGFGSPDRTFYQTLSILQVHPQLGAIFAVDESSSRGVLRCLQETGLLGSIRFIAWGASEELVEAFKRGYIHGLIDDNPEEVGREAVHWLARALREDVRVPERISVEFTLRTYNEEGP